MSKYFIENPESIAKICLIRYHYKLEREYNWTVQHKATKGYKQENYFLVRRGPAFYYNELDTRVKLARRGKSVASAKVRTKIGKN